MNAQPNPLVCVASFVWVNRPQAPATLGRPHIADVLGLKRAEPEMIRCASCGMDREGVELVGEIDGVADPICCEREGSVRR